MNRLTFVALAGILALSATPNAFAWRGAGGGGVYRGSFGGGAVRGPGGNWAAMGPRGSTASGNGHGSWNATGFRGGTASGSKWELVGARCLWRQRLRRRRVMDHNQSLRRDGLRWHGVSRRLLRRGGLLLQTTPQNRIIQHASAISQLAQMQPDLSGQTEQKRTPISSPEPVIEAIPQMGGGTPTPQMSVRHPPAAPRKNFGSTAVGWPRARSVF